MSVPVTLTGRLTADPDLKFAQSGTSVANMRVVTSARKFDKDENKWVDVDTTYWQVAAFRDLANNCVESLKKGDPVIVTGRMKSREFTDKEGNNRTVFEVTADKVAVDLSRVCVTVRKVERVKSAGDDPWISENPF